MELHFYPGQRVLTVLNKKGKLVKRCEAWGGPPKKGDDPHMAEEPTTPGTYIIAEAKPYRTATWVFSKIVWGTKLQDMPDKKDVWYKLPNGKWGSVLKDHKISREEIIKRNKQLYDIAKVPATWVFNDFGPIAIRWFEDLNGNKVLDKNERLSGQMFHTTPENEAEKARGLKLKMTLSHGCIHLKPLDRDSIFALGGFQPKTTFVVHDYTDRI